MKLQSIQLRSLVSSGQPRPLITADVDKLAASIKEIGLIQPITVKTTFVLHGTMVPGWQIIAGHHRVAACRALGWTDIEALVVEDMSHLQAELIEIDENLCRSELTAMQRGKCVKRRQQIRDAMNPAPRQSQPQLGGDALGVSEGVMTAAEELEREQVGQVVPPVAKHGHAQTKSFAAETAAITGESKRDVNRHLLRANTLGNDNADRIIGTSLDKGVELDALIKLPEPVREVLIARAVAGELVTARAAMPPPAPTTRQGESTIAAVCASLKRALRGVLEDTGCLTLEELSGLIDAEQASASDDDIEALSEAVDRLEAWSHGLYGGIQLSSLIQMARAA